MSEPRGRDYRRSSASIFLKRLPLFGYSLLATVVVIVYITANICGARTPLRAYLAGENGRYELVRPHVEEDTQPKERILKTGNNNNTVGGRGGFLLMAGNKQMGKYRQISQVVLSETAGPIIGLASSAGEDFLQLAGQWVSRKKYEHNILSRVLEYKASLDRYFNVSEDSPQFGKRYKTCAVVGNSGVLIHSNNRKRIDKHDMVLRINNAMSASEAVWNDVGAKTTLMLMNSNFLPRFAKLSECQCHPPWQPYPVMVVMCQLKHFSLFHRCRNEQVAPLLMVDPRIDVLSQRLVNYYSVKLHLDAKMDPRIWRKRHPEGLRFSTGFEAVTLALGMCEKVSIFGFGKAKGVQHHWHSSQLGELGEHHYEAEYAFYQDLVNSTDDIPYIDKMGFKLPKVTRFV